MLETAGARIIKTAGATKAKGSCPGSETSISRAASGADAEGTTERQHMSHRLT